ncbi:MAG TPA: DUF695 domain-containing protein [Kofleriaceae bacterium]|nr:DUF695 domain-containing protein [Kofleriaceae bacterium]
MSIEGELWHEVEAKRDDGTPTMFRIRELDRKPTLTRIFVVELPYPKTELSRLPNASDYRRLAEFDEQWLRPACTSLGWEYVGHKIEDGSFFFYTYGCADPNAMIEKLSPYDAGLGFYDDEDPDWQEYGTLKNLLEQAKALPAAAPKPNARTRTTTTAATPMAKPNAKAKAKRNAKATPKAAAKTKTKLKANAKAKAKVKVKVKVKATAKAKPAKRRRR